MCRPAPRRSVAELLRRRGQFAAQAPARFVGSVPISGPWLFKAFAGSGIDIAIILFLGFVKRSAFVQEAQRLGMPLRPLLGEEYGRMLAAMDASLRGLWQRRPWREG